MTGSAAGPRRATVADTFRPPRKMAHVLAADLRRQILRGALAVDQQLPPEAELMVAFDVSRDTLREALRILEAQSLLDVRRGRGGGAVVRRPGLVSAGRYVALLLQLRGTTLADLEEARAVLEPPAATRLVAGLGGEALDHLVALHDAARASVGDPLGFATAVTTFDQAVIELSGNRSIAVIAGILRVIYAGQVFLAIEASEPESAERIARRVVGAHEEFLAAARRRDPVAAGDAWTGYVLGTAGLLVPPGRGRRRIDVVPLWRARAGQVVASEGDGPHGPPRRIAAVVANEIRARIAEGRLAEGDRLSSLADLAVEFGISRPTLREALRILEMESLREVRAGDRAGPRIWHPSTQVAAQLAGTVLEARQVTLADHFHAVRLVEPAMMKLAATRIDRRSLAELAHLAALLTAVIDDTAMFSETWRRAAAVAFGATGNPALGVVAEILQWVRAGTRPAVNVDTDESWTAARARLVALFNELVNALVAGDPAQAGDCWAALLDVNLPFVESHDFAHRLIVDLID
ncbi:FadR/GntR family transcriptional regulator [Frankia sp. AgB1.8]|uniref:FadR/GntR family transcriptional regulator n=1 Tax=Frankia sp. AgB1.8 TaxID=2792839 RepID=UPI0019314E2D|nr:GntR family transcriptional regulator [Frankia sp. AgB1.8]MBL7621072.1 FadR family transcriptional regulator [Frankia sp. AgB1.8]